MKQKQPWEQAPEIWTGEKEFNQAMRNISRRAWNKLPIKFIYKKSKTFKKEVGRLKNGKPKYQNYCLCEICRQEHPATRCQVDHIHPAGKFTDREGFKEWFARLVYIGPDDLQVLCPSCHAKKTYAERRGISFSESSALAPLRAFLSKTASMQKSFLKNKGFSDSAVRNKVLREKSFRKCCM